MTPPSASVAGSRSASAAAELGAQVGQEVELVGRLSQRRTLTAMRKRRSGQLGEGAGHVGKPLKRVAQGAQLPGCGATRRRPAGQPLDVADAIQRLPQTGPAPAVPHVHLHRVEPGVDGGRIAQRREQPLAQEPAAHGRERWRR